jgi:DNA polymerase III epsilon subunit family exonuclease
MDKNTNVSALTFVAFDFETTGFSPTAGDKIIEFGAVKFKDGTVIDTFQALVDPQRLIPEQAGSVSGISDDMVRGKPTAAKVLPEFVRFIGDAVLIAHNADFDMGFLRAALQDAGMPLLPNLVIDTLALARKAFPGLRAYKLQALVSHLNLPPNQAHRALDDSQMCMKVFQAAVESIGFMGDVSLGEVIA